jgi:hypothetical protein
MKPLQINKKIVNKCIRDQQDTKTPFMRGRGELVNIYREVLKEWEMTRRGRVAHRKER